MRLVIAICLVALGGCARTHGDGSSAIQGKGMKEVRFTQRQILDNREALRLTAAYRAKMGIATPTIVPESPHGLGRLDQVRLLVTRPEYGSDRPFIQGVDDASATQPTGKKKAKP